MAESAVHITPSLQQKPSIFEVIAQESLSELLYPSFKIVIQFLESKDPHRYQWLSRWSEEVFLGLNTLLQCYYLNGKGGSFSESFYGLQRVKPDGLLSRRAKCWSAFCLVGLPYLARRVELFRSRLGNLKGVDRTHRALEAGWRAACFIQYLLYLTGRSSAHCPLLSAAGLSLRYCPEQQELSYSWAECWRNPRTLLRLLSGGLGQGLELAAFFLQCLQWYHSDEFSHNKTSSPVPPPPTIPDKNKALGDTSHSCICPVCNQRCAIETALLTSGYVFCYRCIREAVLTNHKCPVTGIPTTLDELIRLYPDQ